jgi:beta-lactamase class A
MRHTTLLCVLALGITGAALTRSLPSPLERDVQASAPLPPAPAAAAVRAPTTMAPRPQRFDRTTISRTVRSYMARRPGSAGVMVTDLRTGLSYGNREDREFVTASVIKVDILTALLLKRSRDDDRLSSGERALAGQMIRYSDNKAADALYAAVGYGPGLARMNKKLGLEDTEPFPTSWGSSKTTAADQVKLMRALIDPESRLDATDRRYVLGLMTSVIREQRWGVSAAARPGERVAIKNGWVPLSVQGSGWAVNTVGRITGPGHDFLVAVCSQDNPTMASGVETVEHLANLVVTNMRRAAR